MGHEKSPRCGESSGRGLKVDSRPPPPHVFILLSQAPSQFFILSNITYVNCLIYLVCSMAHHGPTIPMLAGDS